MAMRDRWELSIAGELMAMYGKRLDKGSEFVKKVTLRFDKQGFPAYTDPDHYEDAALIERAVSVMEQAGYVTAKRAKFTKEILSVSLVTDHVNALCETYGIEHPGTKYKILFDSLEEFQDPISQRYKQFLLDRIDNNLSVKFHASGISELADALTLIAYAQNNDEDILERNLSVRLFSDSKRLQVITGKVDLVMKTVLGINGTEWLRERGILKNPTHVFIKGQGKIVINGQSLVLDGIKGSIALDSVSLEDVAFKDVKNVFTIENLTSFHSFEEPGLIIYLGGFSNHSKRHLIDKLKHLTDDFRHFGDIDYGGFMILDHLIRTTGLDIKPYRMDIETLEAHRAHAKHVGQDTSYMKKLESLLELETVASSHDTIRHMIRQGIILEQEAVEGLPH
jgi:hypothetical protein